MTDLAKRLLASIENHGKSNMDGIYKLYPHESRADINTAIIELDTLGWVYYRKSQVIDGDKKTFLMSGVLKNSCFQNRNSLTILPSNYTFTLKLKTMKWTPIDKAKVKFDQVYLIASKEQICTGSLHKSETTAKGIEHTFLSDVDAKPVIATHIAIVTDPNETE